MNMKYLLLLGALLLPIHFALAADPAPDSASAAASAGDEEGFSGKVIETTNTAGYTYVRVDTGAKKLWAATTQFPVKVGDSVTVGRRHAHDRRIIAKRSTAILTSFILPAAFPSMGPMPGRRRPCRRGILRSGGRARPACRRGIRR